MPRQKIDLHRKVRDVLQHIIKLPPQASCPIRHYEKSVNVGSSLIKYIADHIETDDTYQSVYDRHMGHLQRMVLVELLESFERFLKELASVCVDFLAPYAIDDRFDEFIPRRGEQVAAFVHAGSIGRALCESDTWLKNETINRRFKSLLKTPFDSEWELLFPGRNQQPVAERERAATLAILWQIRHTLAHNVGVITQSDAMKFRMLMKTAVGADQQLFPSQNDLRYIKRFLSETATHVNKRVGQRLAKLTESFYDADPDLFDLQTKADELSRSFSFPITLGQQAGIA